MKWKKAKKGERGKKREGERERMCRKVYDYMIDVTCDI